MSTTMLGRYRLDERIGSGGMGEVWRAHDPVLEREVAIKVLHPDATDDVGALERLRVEARLAGSLHHPHVVGVLDYGEQSDELGLRPCLIMPMVDGITLSETLRTSGPLSSGETMRVVADIADGLSAAHLAGIVHRDLKPANVMIERSGRAMILDFGIARAADTSPLTGTGTIVGTADFISPEQAGGRSADASSDLYALGVVAHCCLTGRAPFHRTSAVATAVAHLNDDPPPLPDVPDEVSALILQMLAKSPGDRPKSAEDVRDRARRLADGVAPEPSGGPTTAWSSPTAAIPVADPTPTASLHQPSAATEAGGRTGRRRMVLLGAVAVTLAVAVALGSVLLLRGSGGALVPDVRGRTAAEATTLLKNAGLTSTARTVDVAGEEKGAVVKQTPAAGTEADDGDAVLLTVASGYVKLPDLTGVDAESARSQLADLGLSVESSTRPSSTAGAGTVVSFAPTDRVPTGSTVRVVVAVAPQVVQPSAPAVSETGKQKPEPKGKGNKKAKNDKKDKKGKKG